MGRHSFQRRRLRADLITTFNIFTSFLIIAPNLFFLLFARSGLKGHPYKAFQGASHRGSRGWAFLLRVVNTRIRSRLPSLQLLLSLKRIFPFLPLTEHPSPHKTSPSKKILENRKKRTFYGQTTCKTYMYQTMYIYTLSKINLSQGLTFF